MNKEILPIISGIIIATAQTLIKIGVSKYKVEGIFSLVLIFIKTPILLSALFLSTIAYLLWSYSLTSLNVLSAYLLTLGSSYLTLILLSKFILKSDMDSYTILGGLLIIIGITFIAKSLHQ